MNEDTKLRVGAPRAGVLPTLQALVKTMRPKQWFKNVVVFAPLVFDEKLFRPGLFLNTTIAFALFCLISSTVYIINDLARRIGSIPRNGRGRWPQASFHRR
jgi:hypothetical protein